MGNGKPTLLGDSDLPRYISKMLAVVNKGIQVKAAGAHYLWGAQRLDGSAPMHKDEYVPGKEGEKKTFMRCAYMPQQNGTIAICAGRTKADDVLRKPLWNGTDLRGPGPLSRWPRYFEDTSTDGSPKVPSALYWGEDCTNKLHFDCAGFVRYCFRQVLGDDFLPVNQRMRDLSAIVWSAGNSTQPLASVPIWPADLLYDDNYTHVGIATGHSQFTRYGVTNPGQAIHCYSATVGVLMTPIDQKVIWKYVYRWPKWTIQQFASYYGIRIPLPAVGD